MTSALAKDHCCGAPTHESHVDPRVYDFLDARVPLIEQDRIVTQLEVELESTFHALISRNFSSSEFLRRLAANDVGYLHQWRENVSSLVQRYRLYYHLSLAHCLVRLIVGSELAGGAPAVRMRSSLALYRQHLLDYGHGKDFHRNVALSNFSDDHVHYHNNRLRSWRRSVLATLPGAAGLQKLRMYTHQSMDDGHRIRLKTSLSFLGQLAKRSVPLAKTFLFPTRGRRNHTPLMPMLVDAVMALHAKRYKLGAAPQCVFTGAVPEAEALGCAPRAPGQVVLWCPNHGDPGQDLSVMCHLPLPRAAMLFFASRTCLPKFMADRLRASSGVIPVGSGYDPLTEMMNGLDVGIASDIVIYPQGNLDAVQGTLPAREHFESKTLPLLIGEGKELTIVPVATRYKMRMFWVPPSSRGDNPDFESERDSSVFVHIHRPLQHTEVVGLLYYRCLALWFQLYWFEHLVTDEKRLFGQLRLMTMLKIIRSGCDFSHRSHPPYLNLTKLSKHPDSQGLGWHDPKDVTFQNILTLRHHERRLEKEREGMKDREKGEFHPSERT